jgi:hypothetical protein
MKRVAIPAIIIMLAVAGFVATAGWNASEEPRQVMTLTERELSLPFQIRRDDGHPALSLLVQFDGRYDPMDARNWLTESTLRELGFALHIPAGSPQAGAIYDRVPPRVAWVVFEYDGPAWRERERRRQLQAEHLRVGVRSRLLPVDAGLDYDRLRARYPSGHLILRGVIGVSYVPPERGGPLVHGTLRQVVPARVAVPFRFRSLLTPLVSTNARGDGEPRYEADLAVGALGLPYLIAVRVQPRTLRE